MPKSMVVDPREVRKPQMLKIKDIPVNQYKPDFKKESGLCGTERLVRSWHDMVVIREFESMLNTFKTQGAWNGREYDH
jgi:2-oxoisovalerate dehydrogenase E1 component